METQRNRQKIGNKNVSNEKLELLKSGKVFSFPNSFFFFFLVSKFLLIVPPPDVRLADVSMFMDEMVEQTVYPCKYTYIAST